MNDYAIRIENLSKRYRIGRKDERPETLAGAIGGWLGAPLTNFRRLRRMSHFSPNGQEPDVIWALRDVSFNVREGEVVGLIGRNGAGKSTLLKILSRITPPTSGRVVLNGRVASLLEVGTGFHGDLTGRENVYLNGTILGMAKAEIDRNFDEIVAFSGVEKFIDTPIKRYSSGMKVRLAFAVAAHLQPEILLIDEVLAVGDAEFQKKCLGKMEDVARQGRTVLFVSHNMAAVQSLCGYAYWLEHGNVAASGNVASVIQEYLQAFAEHDSQPLHQRTDRAGDGRIRFTAFKVATNISGEELSTALASGSPATFRIAYEGAVQGQNVKISIGIINNLGERVLYMANDLVGRQFLNLSKQGEFICHLDKLPIRGGEYTVNLQCKINGLVTDWVQRAARISIVDGDYYGTGQLPPKGYTPFIVDHDWDIHPVQMAGLEQKPGLSK